MPSSLALTNVVDLLDGRYPQDTAEEWDAVGLVCGRPSAPVRRVLFAVDPDPAVVAEAIAWRADLIVTHHPLFLRPVHEVAATGWKGRMIHDLIDSGIGLFCAHTNADVAVGGVNDALAVALGLRATVPLSPSLSRSQRAVATEGPPGLGRVGRLEHSESLSDFIDRVAAALPTTRAGLRIAGDLQAPVETVAVCGGAGDSLLDAARLAAADVYVTADLRHHLASDSRLSGGPALVDPGHWASEWPWLPVAAKRLVDDAAAVGTTVDVAVSSVVTDPWSAHRPFDR